VTVTVIKGYLTVPEAAERRGLSRPYVYELVREGRLECVRVGRTILIRTSSVRRFKRRPRGRPRKKKGGRQS